MLHTFVFTEYANQYTWGVHFTDTTRRWVQKGNNAVAGLITASGITDSAILKLTFETSNKVKTLNAIDTPSSSEDNQGNIAETPIEDDLTLGDSITQAFKNEKVLKALKIIGFTLLGLAGIYIVSLIIRVLKSSFNNIKKK